jgi:hypothetical protein
MRAIARSGKAGARKRMASAREVDLSLVDLLVMSLGVKATACYLDVETV